ncbi:hypothetical protein N7449_005341 [Penicillium cf. viridicatum]|uniref:Uncharacterized protein n=1 Tax=Penicillium cf. viridicatum TaxID=2972119 RepID=A0A9W9ML48_9EURO|nr:hypothetical protein N7449_005341 [Penicillium cf. viridicatum]
MGPPQKHHHRRTRRREQAFAEMKADPTASPQVKRKTTQKLEEPSISESTLQPRAGDAPVKTPDDDHEQEGRYWYRSETSEDIEMHLAPKIDPTEPHIKIEKPDPDSATRLEDQKPGTGVKHDPSCDDIEMPLASTSNLTKPSIKVEKSDPGLEVRLEDQKVATGVKEYLSCEDTEMSLAPKIDPTEPSIKAEKPGPDLAAGVGERDSATGVKQHPSCGDAGMPLAPKIDPNELMTAFDHSDSKHSLTTFDSQDLLEEIRTQNSPDSSDPKPEGQLCLLPSNLTRDPLQLKHEMNKALDVGETIEEKKRFYDTYQNVSGETHLPSAGPSA